MLIYHIERDQLVAVLAFYVDQIVIHFRIVPLSNVQTSKLFIFFIYTDIGVFVVVFEHLTYLRLQVLL